MMLSLQKQLSLCKPFALANWRAVYRLHLLSLLLPARITCAQQVFDFVWLYPFFLGGSAVTMPPVLLLLKTLTFLFFCPSLGWFPSLGWVVLLLGVYFLLSCLLLSFFSCTRSLFNQNRSANTGIWIQVFKWEKCIRFVNMECENEQNSWSVTEIARGTSRQRRRK